jgi:ATP-dependent Clp protease protease subunit
MDPRVSDMAEGRRDRYETAMPTPEQHEPIAPLPERVSGTLFEARTVLVFGEITPVLAAVVTSQLLALDAKSDAPIRVIVNSPGGHVESGDTIHDVIRFVRAPITMIGTGYVASAGALIYVAAEKEKRFALPNTRFLLHQPLGGFGGPASDIEIEAREILAARERINRIFERATGREFTTIMKETERNLWLSAEHAQRYGLVHRIIERAQDL